MLNKTLKLVACYNFKQAHIKPIIRQTQKSKVQQYYERAEAKHQRALKRGDLQENVKQEYYEHPVNYNKEQYKQYTKAVAEAKNHQQPVKRKRILLYDRPRYDLDISNYKAWPIYNEQLAKDSDHSAVVVCKIELVPKDLAYVFGSGSTPFRNTDATREYDFQDSNFTKFLVYDYQQTTQYRENKTPEQIERQKFKDPLKRNIERPTVEEFWTSDEPRIFRVNAQSYSEYRKFRVWITKAIQEGLKEPKSYHQRMVEKWPLDNTFDNYETQYELNAKPAVYTFDRSYFLEKNEKYDNTKEFQDKIEPPKIFKEEEKITQEQLAKYIQDRNQI